MKTVITGNCIIGSTNAIDVDKIIIIARNRLNSATKYVQIWPRKIDLNSSK